MPDAARPGTDQGINLTEQRLTAEDRAALYPDLLCPVPSPEDRMRDARTDTGPVHPAVQRVLAEHAHHIQPRDPNRPAPTFATYLDATERDQLDARAAAAEMVAGDALDDRDAYKEARDVLRAEINRVEQTRQEQVQALNAKLQDALWTAGQHATTAASLRQQRDRTLADLTDAGNEVDQLTVDNARLRSELGAAQELIAVLDDVTEQFDRARARYATRQEGQHFDPNDCAFCVAPALDRLPNGADAGCPLHGRARVEEPTLGSPSPRAQEPPVIDAAHLARQRAFSERTFGPGPRTEGVLDHIRKELKEIEAAPDDLGEWVDVVILALDGAWRAGHEPQQIVDAIVAKQARNEARTWPDWRTADPGRAIEHDRSTEREG